MGRKGWILEAIPDVFMSNNRNVPLLFHIGRTNDVVPVSMGYNNGDQIRAGFFSGMRDEVGHTGGCIDQYGIPGNGIHHEVGIGGNRASGELVDSERHGYLLLNARLRGIVTRWYGFCDMASERISRRWGILNSEHIVAPFKYPLNSYQVDDDMPEVLVVDDDPQIGEVLEQLLREEGFRVAREADGLSALERIERAKPRIVLADICMPRLDGVSLCKEISKRWDDVEVILMSAAETPRGLPVSFLQKPFDIDTLLDTLHSHLR
jgi:CheY-like chemotaxis protein